MAPGDDQRPYYIDDLCPDCQTKLNTMIEWLKRHGPPASTPEEPTTTPEDTLRAAGISSRRQACYQRRMSQLLGRRGARS
jgi:hypothetical protein